MRKYEFVDRYIALIREELEKKLPKEAKIDDMNNKAREILIKIVNRR